MIDLNPDCKMGYIPYALISTGMAYSMAHFLRLLIWAGGLIAVETVYNLDLVER